MYITNADNKNPGTISYKLNIPPKATPSLLQIITLTPPVIIPAIAPFLVVLFQKSENNTIGPNVAPNPAHANETIVNTELSGSLAIIAATTAITNSVILATVNESSYFAATVTII